MFALSKSEVRQILEVIDLDSPFGRRDYLLILFLFHTGLRVGECAGLIMHLVALDGQPRQYLHLPASICKGSRGRVVPLNRVAQACISKMIAFNTARGFSTAPAAPLFQNKCHGPLSVRSIQQLVAIGNSPGLMSAQRLTRFVTRTHLTWWPTVSPQFMSKRSWGIATSHLPRSTRTSARNSC